MRYQIMANNSNISGWGELIPAPKESYKDWISIEYLLHKYTIPTMAEAIDKSNVQCIDATGRRILATDGDENDIHSKQFAKKHLGIRNSVNNGSTEQINFSEERLAVEGSPLEKFGWPKDKLPDFTKINPHVRPANIQPDNDSNDAWTQRTLEEFEEEYKNEGSYEKAGKLHGVSRQRYTEVIKDKRKQKNWNSGA